MRGKGWARGLAALVVFVGITVGAVSADEARRRAAQQLIDNPNYVTTENVALFLEMRRHVAKTMLATAKRGRVSPKAKRAVEWQHDQDRVVYRTVKDKEREVARWEAEVDSPQLPAFATGSGKTPGQLGRLQSPGTTYRILQILEPDLALIVATSRGSEWTFQLRTPRVAAMQEGQRFACSAYRNPHAKDGLPGVFLVVEKVQYATVLGAAKTVDRLQEVDLKQVVTARHQDSR